MKHLQGVKVTIPLRFVDDTLLTFSKILQYCEIRYTK